MYKRKLVFAAACMGMLLFGMSLITLGSVASSLKIRFHLDEISSGTLFSILPVGILIGSLLFGPLCDRYGYKLLAVISCIGVFSGFEGIAFSHSLGLLKVCIFLFGISGGAVNGISNAVVADISKKAKGANLSLAGVFFGIGALGMPFVLGSLENRFSFDEIISTVGFLVLAIGIFYSFIQFPPSKKAQGFSKAKTRNLFKDKILLLIAFFLFCQSSFEAIVNNWTTTYLITQFLVDDSNALYALTSYVVGMTAMRLLIGTVFRTISQTKMILASLIIILAGIILIQFGKSFFFAVAGLVLIGCGLAGGFPIMLGFVGNMYAEQSGTAFSFALVIALIGNMLVNYFMGLIAQAYGIHHFTTVIFIELGVMLWLCLLIFRSSRLQKKMEEVG